ncbi:MAG: M23 family metallopeptidase [Candidatus Micrarchaeota archaeon]
MNSKKILLMAVLAVITGSFVAYFMMSSNRPLEVGFYKPPRGLYLPENTRTGTYNSALGILPIQNPVSFDIMFEDPVPWFNNTPSPGVEFLVLENELIRANYDGMVKFIRSDRAWGRTHIDIDNGELDGHRYITSYEYVGDIRVRPGQELKMGEVIGQGFVGRGVVYFGISKDGVPIDPIRPA